MTPICEASDGRMALLTYTLILQFQLAASALGTYLYQYHSLMNSFNGASKI